MTSQTKAADPSPAATPRDAHVAREAHAGLAMPRAHASVRIQMESELHLLLGSMLGLLEVLASDVEEPLGERQRKCVSEAARNGHMLKDRVDAVLLLSTSSAVPGSAEGRAKRAHVPLRRLI